MTTPVEQLSFIPTSATTKRSLGDWTGDVFNVKNFGAVGNGIANDTSAIQACFDAAGTLNSYPKGGAIVFFPPGTYAVTAPIYVAGPYNLRIVGSGKFNTIVQGSFVGFILATVAQVGAGGNVSISVTGAADNGAGLIQLTLSGSSPSGAVTDPASCLVQNAPAYTISGVNGTLGYNALNGSGKSFLRVSATLVDVIGSASTGIYTNGGSISGGTTQANITMEGLQLTNGNQAEYSGGLYIGYCEKMMYFHDCLFDGFVAAMVVSNIWVGGQYGATVSDCYFSNGSAVEGKADQTLTGAAGGGGGSVGYSGFKPGSTGIYMGQGLLTNCRIVGGVQVGLRIGGVSCAIINCSVERCNYGVIVGADAIGNWKANGCMVYGVQTEAVVTGIEIARINGGVISNNILTGSNGLRNFADIASASWVGGTVTATTANDHNLPAGVSYLGTQSINPTNWSVNGTGSDLAIACTKASSNTFTYALAGDPTGTPFVSGQWTYASLNAINAWDTCQNVIFEANNTGSWGGVRDIDFDGNGATYGIHNNITLISQNMTYECRLATYGPNRAAVQFVNCTNVVSNVRYQDLPGEAGVYQTGPFEGQEYLITDSSLTVVSSNFGQTVGGSGGNHAKVRYDGSNWILVG